MSPENITPLSFSTWARGNEIYSESRRRKGVVQLPSLDRTVEKQAMESSPPTITVQVKFAGRTIPVELPTSASTAELKLLLQPLTNVLPRGQRLICKGTESQTLTAWTGICFGLPLLLFLLLSLRFQEKFLPTPRVWARCRLGTDPRSCSSLRRVFIRG